MCSDNDLILYSSVGDPQEPALDIDSIVVSPTTITLSWSLSPSVTGSEVNWELADRRRREVHNTEGGASGQLPGGQNSYTINSLMSYDITVTVFNPAGSSSTTFTYSTATGSYSGTFE